MARCFVHHGRSSTWRKAELPSQQRPGVYTVLLATLFLLYIISLHQPIHAATFSASAALNRQQPAAAAAPAAPAQPLSFCAEAPWSHANQPSSMSKGGNMLKVYHNIYFHNG
eukprot:jgi/Chrzof1/4738/Cz14g24140.t1